MSLLAEAMRMVPDSCRHEQICTPCGHDPYEHVEWFFALQTPYLVGSVLPGYSDYNKSNSLSWPSNGSLTIETKNTLPLEQIFSIDKQLLKWSIKLPEYADLRPAAYRLLELEMVPYYEEQAKAALSNIYG